MGSESLQGNELDAGIAQARQQAEQPCLVERLRHEPGLAGRRRPCGLAPEVLASALPELARDAEFVAVHDAMLPTAIPMSASRTGGVHENLPLPDQGHVAAAASKPWA